MSKGKLIYSGNGSPVYITNLHSQISHTFDDVEFESITIKTTSEDGKAIISGKNKYGYDISASYPEWGFVIGGTASQREPVADEDDLNDCIGQHHYREKVGELYMDGKLHTTYLDGTNCRCEPSDVTIQGIPINEISGAKSVTYTPDVDVNALITERGARYGKFKDGAEIMRDLKHVMHEVDGWNSLSPSQKEALDMIQHKIGRILNGDPTYDDSWKDIAGYATLIVNELNGEIK